MLRAADEDGPAGRPVATPKKTLVIGNSEQLREFYVQRFTCVQQTACKHIGKAFVKVVAPKKQSHNPYIRGMVTAPVWWPKPWGEGERDRVRHREPDHLWKRERLVLLPHLLKLVIERHPDIQEPNVDVAALEQKTMEMLSNWFTDRTRPNNAKKEGILKELFKVAKMEERYRRGEIGTPLSV